jgi:hypothetical protein
MDLKAIQNCEPCWAKQSRRYPVALFRGLSAVHRAVKFKNGGDDFHDMTADPLDNPAPALSSEPLADRSKTADPFDPLGWELPAVCKDCDKEFKVPYRHFQAGVVFHCPHCHGSYVPTLPMYQRVHDAFETFYGRMRRERDHTSQSSNDTGFKERFGRELAEFHKTLQRLARELHPAGKMVRRKGLSAMFT